MIVSYVLNLGAELVGKKWRAVIIWHLSSGPKRFSELKRDINGISVKVLSEVLKEMEENELIIRKQYPTIPVKVTYEIHPDAVPFVEANVVCTIRIAEYVCNNHARYGLSGEFLEELNAWIKKNKVYIKLASLIEAVSMFLESYLLTPDTFCTIGLI